MNLIKSKINSIEGLLHIRMCSKPDGPITLAACSIVEALPITSEGKTISSACMLVVFAGPELYSENNKGPYDASKVDVYAVGCLACDLFGNRSPLLAPEDLIHPQGLQARSSPPPPRGYYFIRQV